MKSRAVKTIVSIFTFLLILAVVFSVLRPVYSYINRTLRAAEQKYLGILEDRTGLSVSYRSLSPSILSGIRLRGISIKSAATGEEILSIGKAHLGYSLPRLLRGDMDRAFTRLSINDVTFEYTRSRFEVIAQRISLLRESRRGRKGNAGAFISTDMVDIIQQVVYALPFDIHVRNIRLRFSDSLYDVTAAVRELAFQRRGTRDGLSGGLAGYVQASVPALGKDTFGFTYRIDGTLRNMLSGSSITLSMDEYQRASYTLNRTQFVFRYTDDVFSLRSTQRILPYSVTLTLDNNTALMHASVKMQDLDPFSLIKGPALSGMLESLKGTEFSTDSMFDCDLRSREYSWSADASLSLSENFTLGGQSVALNASGNNSDINVRKLSARGDLASFSFTGSYNIPGMMPSGELLVDWFTLPTNGNRLSGELYVEPMGHSFMCFIPELTLGDQTLNTLQLSVRPSRSSVDFEFSMADSFHEDFDGTGSISIDGILNLENGRELQASASIDRFFMDTILSSVAFVTDTEERKRMSGMADRFAPFVTSLEFFFSTDFKSVTYNFPYALFLNTRRDRQMLFLSFDGTEQTLQVTQCDLVYDRNTVSASFDGDYSVEDGNALFSASFNVNDMPYQFNGVYKRGELFSVTGDYGFDISVSLGNAGRGTASISSLPIAYDKYVFLLGLESGFSFGSDRPFSLALDRFELSELTSNFSTHPYILLSGSMDSNGALISSITLADTGSSLEGSGFFLWNKEDGVVETATMELSMSDRRSGETFSLQADATNPLRYPLSAEHIKKDFYFSAQARIISFALGRFFNGQRAEDTLTAFATASGTLENPYLSLSLESLSMRLGGAPFFASGNASVLENAITIPDFSARWKNVSLSGISSQIDLGTFSGELTGSAVVEFGRNSLSAPFTISLENLSPGETAGIKVPEYFSVKLVSPGIGGSILTDVIPVHVNLIRSPGRFDVMTDEYFGTYGEILNNGALHFTIDRSKPLNFTLDGTIRKSVVNLDFNDLYCDISAFSGFIASDLLGIYSGTISGSVQMEGMSTDPSIYGTLVLDNPDFNLPSYIPAHITSDSVTLEMNQNELRVPPTSFSVGDGSFLADAYFSLDRYSLSNMEFSARTKSSKGIPIDIRIPFVRIKGRTSLDASISMQGTSLSLDGDVELHNTEVTIMENLGTLVSSGGEESPGRGSNMRNRDMVLDLNFLIGQKVHVELNPILRALIAPNTRLTFSMDTSSSLWKLVGDAALRGGEVRYLSRSFYLKEGHVLLNENQSKFDPYLTLRAETREHDDAGNPVTITLSAIRQNMSSFSPSLYSTPAKSENEILSMMGQIARADSSNVGEMVTAAADYGLQSLLWRRLEGALRDLANFDIFSVRNSFLQNTVRNGLNADSNSELFGKLFSNFFDNSTVYIGKYFGDTIYAEALMHWTYSGTDRSISELDASGIVFQPEIGFELAAPFATIRLDSVFDLDFTQMGNRNYMPDTSLTLSWRFTF